MKRTFFDKVILVIMGLLIILFVGLAGYTTYETQKVLVREKQSNLLNEATLLSEQSISSYIQGETTFVDLQLSFDEFEDALKICIWFYAPDGKLIAASNPMEHINVPNNLFSFDETIEKEKGFTRTGTFFDIFDGMMISIGVPFFTEDGMKGFLVLHTAMTELDSLQDEMLGIMYMPFLVALLVVGLVLAYLSGTVVRPIARLNNTAREYAKGNFDAKTGVERDDEIGELSESLEYMASELSKLDEYRKNFIANISHDFRSPLTSIKGYLVAMLDGTIPVEKYDRYLNIVLSETGRLTKLTSGLLELNDFDTYGPILKRQKFNLLEVMAETKNTFEGLCEEKHIRLWLDCRTSNTVVYADKMKIGQVIYNLVDNAIKFSPEHGEITAKVYEKNGKLFVSIKDEGAGIEKDKQNKVWERFYKTDKSRGKDKKGTGLGLAITKEIIKAHGEHINLISTEGVGSEFVFSLSREPNDKITKRN